MMHIIICPKLIPFRLILHEINLSFQSTISGQNRTETIAIFSQRDFLSSPTHSYLQNHYNITFMSRSQPYRGKMPVHILQLLDVASRITLFLVGQSGPLSFTFKDRLGQKYKTSIGAQLKCTCSSGRNDHCIHTAYVMLKVFKVSADNPIIWQAAYVDSQLSDLVSGKHTVATKRRMVRPVFDEYNELPSESLYKKEIEKQFSFESKVEKMKLNEDSVCPICQEAMTEDMCLSHCKVKCGNNFHLECLKIWAQHKKTTQTKITCPMCRTPFHGNYLKQLEIEEREYKKKQKEKVKLNFKCASCGVDIPHSVHKCLLCTNYELCECCYKSNKHIKHPFIKQLKEEAGKWCGAEERRESELKIKNFIDNKRKQKNINEQLLQKLRKIEEDPTKLLDYVASSYPYVSKYISENIDPYKKLGFDATDMKCMKCYSSKMIFLRRLTCGHFIDHECLKENIRKEKFFCQDCGSKVLKGYENLVNREKQLQMMSDQQGFDVSEEFNPRKMQLNYRSNQEEYNFVRMQEQEPTLTDVLGGVVRERATHADRFNYNRMKDRISNNIVREPIREQSTGRLTHRTKKREEGGVSNRETQNNNSIRIRHVSRSTQNRREEELVGRHSQPKGQKKRFNNKEMGEMLQAMIGRKLF